MMFTSMPAERRQKDPTPFRVIETGERVNESAFGTPGITILFDPRPEFMPANKLPVNAVLEHIRQQWSTDTWGSSMLWLTAIALWTKKIYGAVPKTWRTDLPLNLVELGFLGELVSEIGETAILPQLLHAGAVMERLADCAEASGNSYPLIRPSEDSDY